MSRRFFLLSTLILLSAFPGTIYAASSPPPLPRGDQANPASSLTSSTSNPGSNSSLRLPPIIVKESKQGPPDDTQQEKIRGNTDNEYFYSNQLNDTFSCEYNVPPAGPGGVSDNSDTGSTGTHIENTTVPFHFDKKDTSTAYRGFLDSFLHGPNQIITPSKNFTSFVQGNGIGQQSVPFRSQLVLKSQTLKAYIYSLAGQDSPGVDEALIWDCGGQTYDLSAKTAADGCRPVYATEVAYAILTNPVGVGLSDPTKPGQILRSPFFELDKDGLKNIPFPSDLAGILRQFYPSQYNSLHSQPYQPLPTPALYRTLYQKGISLAPKGSAQSKITVEHISGKKAEETRTRVGEGSANDTLTQVFAQVRPANSKLKTYNQNFCQAVKTPEYVDEHEKKTILGQIVALVSDATNEVLRVLDAPKKVIFTYDNRITKTVNDLENTVPHLATYRQIKKYSFDDTSVIQSTVPDEKYPIDPAGGGAVDMMQFQQCNLAPSKWGCTFQPRAFQAKNSVSYNHSQSNSTPSPSPTYAQVTPTNTLPDLNYTSNIGCGLTSTDPQVQATLDCLSAPEGYDYYYNHLCRSENLENILATIDTALKAGIDPLLALTIWVHESDSGSVSGAAQFGIVREDIGRGDFGAQLNTFLQLPSAYANGSCQSEYAGNGFSETDNFLGRFSAAGLGRCPQPNQSYGNNQEGQPFVDAYNRFYSYIINTSKCPKSSSPCLDGSCKK